MMKGRFHGMRHEFRDCICYRSKRAGLEMNRAGARWSEVVCFAIFGDSAIRQWQGQKRNAFFVLRFERSYPFIP